MCNYEAKSTLFMIKTADLYHVPIKSYSKNTHPPFILKWILVTALSIGIMINIYINQNQYRSDTEMFAGDDDR